jgi:hypothetical protein
MPLPHFIVIGSPKAGTTSLCEALGRHSRVYLYPAKETHFFNHEYHRGFDWYEARFAGAPKGTLIGEGTPDYTEGVESAVTAARMARHLPHAKLVYVVRDPVRRLESHFVQDADNGLPVVSLTEALKTRPRLIETSRYFARLNDYLAHFPREQMHIVFFEELVRDPAGALSRCAAFLGLNPEPDMTLAQRNDRASKSRDTYVMKRLRSLSFFRDVKDALPRSLVTSLRPLMRRRLTDSEREIEWTDEARAFVDDALASDIPAFLDFAGRPRDFWASASS